MEGKWQTLYQDTVEAVGDHRPYSTTASPDHLRRCRKTLLQGAVGKTAQQLFSNSPPCASNRENAEKLSQLHPTPTIPVTPLPRNNLPPSFKFTEAEVRRGLRTLPYHSAPGPDALRPSHFRSLANSPGGIDPQRSPVSELSKFINDAVDGKLPLSMRDWVSGAALLGIPHNQKLRPIAIGLSLRRLISRLLMSKVTQDQELLSYFHPHQLAVGTRGGCEAIVHAARQTIEALQQEDILMVQVDASNAFNSIERNNILSECKTHLAPLARWIHYAYGGKPKLLFGDIITFSLTGVQQGDPLSMLLFALAIQPLIRSIAERFPDLDLNAWLADDGTFIGKPETVAAALQFLITEGDKIGFLVNLLENKTKGWWPKLLPTPNLRPTTVASLPRRINNSEATVILGAPVGTAAGCAQIIEKKLQDVELMWENLVQLQDPQISYHLLRFCASASRLTYALRCTPPHVTIPICRRFDEGMRKVFERIHGNLDNRCWEIATIPLRNGGLGLTKSGQIANIAYASSILATRTLITGLMPALSLPILHLITEPLSSAMQEFSLPTEYSGPALLSRTVREGHGNGLQHDLFDAITKNLTSSLTPAQSLQDPVSQRRRIRLQSCSTPDATRPYASIPTPDTWIQPEIWRTMTALRLGKRLYAGSEICPTCAEGQYRAPRQLDPEGHHATTCPGRSGRVRRHNGLRDLLIDEIAKPPVSIRALREWSLPQDVDFDARQRRRLDILIDNVIFAAEPTALDVTIISPHSNPYKQIRNATSATALAMSEKMKLRKYGNACKDVGVSFVPFATDIYGSIAVQATQAITKIADFVASRRGTSPKYEETRLKMKISLHIVRAVCIAINRRNQPSLTVETGH